MENDIIWQQKNEWKRKGWSIPEIRGRKQEWFSIVVELVDLLSKKSYCRFECIA